MDKRLPLFLAISVAILIGHALVMRALYPPPPEEVAQKDDAAKKKGQNDGKPAKDDKQNGKQKKQPDNGKANGEQNVPDENPPEQPAPEVAALSPQWATLGSVDPQSGYRMLVTLTNRGAAVQRLELGEYFELEDRSGDLGQVITVPVAAGLKVLDVGGGTAAAKAGLQVDDVITKIGTTAIADRIALIERLKLTSPGDKIQLNIQRNGKPQVLPVTLTRHQLSVIRPEVYPDGGVDPLSLLVTLFQVDDQKLEEDQSELGGVRLLNSYWELLPAQPGEAATKDKPRTAATFRAVLPKLGLTVEKRYELKPYQPPAEDAPQREPGDPPPQLGYDLDVSISIKNTGDKERKVAYLLNGPNGLPVEGWWYAYKITSSGLRDVVNGFNASNGEPEDGGLVNTKEIADGDQPAFWPEQPIRYIGVDAQYFSALLMPQTAPTDTWYQRSKAVAVGPPNKQFPKLTNVSVQLTSKVEKLAPGKSFTHHLRMFAGPKAPEVVAAYGLGDLVDYGWFDSVAVLMTAILHFFYSVVGNYGLAIIMLTVGVRLCLHPLSRKQAKSAAQMQAMQPEIAKLKEKYKNDKEGMARAQMELFRKYNANPLSGCLVMLVQLPIFIGLYRGLQADIALRDAPLVSEAFGWCTNLAAPDMLFKWEGFFPFFVQYGGYLGPYFNLLPVFTIILFVLQQKLFTPPPTDEQQAMQMKMMKFMMIFIGFMFFKVASGLCLYFIASSLWGIGERKLLGNVKGPGDPPTGEPAKKDKTDWLAFVTGGNDNGANGAGGKRGKARRKQKGRN